MILQITLTTAGAAALVNFWLAVRTGRVRTASKVSIGDGGNDLLARRMRAHANFVEYAPFILILMGLIEMARGSSLWLWGVSILFIVGRILHPFGMDSEKRMPLRMAGIIITMLVLVGLAAYAIAIPYFTPALNAEAIQFAQSAPGATKLN